MSLHLLAMIVSTPLAAALAATGIAAAPVLIHLLNRKRYLVVPWAAMRFLVAAQKRNVRRLRLEQWALLAVRVLIGVLIVTAMAAVMPWAEPVWRRLIPAKVIPVQAQGRTHRIVVIDGSFAMAARTAAGETRFDAAKRQARALLDGSGPGDGFSLVNLSSSAQVIVTGPADDRRKVADEIDDLEPVHGGADVAGGIRLATELAARPLGKYTRREVVFVSDMRRSNWPITDSAANSPLAELGKHADLVLLDVAGQDMDNVAVTAVQVGDATPRVDATTSVTATVQNFGRAEAKEWPVGLRIARAPVAGERMHFRDLGQKLLNLKPGDSATVTFRLEEHNRFREPGEYVVQVQTGDDALRLDNTRSFVVNVREAIPVLVVDSSDATEPLDAAAEWVRRALRPGGKDASDSILVPTVCRERDFANPNRFDLSKYACVFLCDPAALGVREVARLEAYLQRGGTIVLGLGPNALRQRDEYNRLLFAEGKGLLPGRIVGPRLATGKEYFALSADEDAFRRPPLSAYRSDRERAALALPPFHEYVRLNLPPTSAARRVFSFATLNGETAKSPADPAIIEAARHRGRVLVYTSTFNPERIDQGRYWSGWPLHPTCLPFWHEAVRFLVSDSGRKELPAGEPLEDPLPATAAGLKARLIRGDGGNETEVEAVEALSRVEGAVATFTRTNLAGTYRVSTGVGPDSPYCINVPVFSPTGGAESDLRRLTPGDLQTTAGEAILQWLNDACDYRLPRVAGREPVIVTSQEREPQGSAVARFLLITAFALMLAEVAMAYWLGSARASTRTAPQNAPTRRPLLVTALWLLPTLGGLFVLGTWAHAMVTDDLLGYLPNDWRSALEARLEVPQASPGEGTRWRLKSLPYLTGSWRTDRWLVGGLAMFTIVYVTFVYRRERVGHVPTNNRRVFHPLLPPALMRIQLMLVTLFILLPQLQLVFEREAWPDVVLIFDDSKSMATVEPFADPVLAERAEELAEAWADIAKPRIEAANRRLTGLKKAKATDAVLAEIAMLEKRIANWRKPHRLNLVKALLASGSQDWLRTLLGERKLRVHLYRASGGAVRIADLGDPEQCEKMLEEVFDLMPEGDTSRLGDAVESVLKEFRGRSLAAIMLFSDGQVTHGQELAQAAESARRKKTPLFFAGVGDATPRPDLAVTDLRAEREVNVRDRLLFSVKVTAQGRDLPEQVPVTLYEIVNGVPVRRDGLSVTPSDRPVQLGYAPETPGEKLFVIETPAIPGETNRRNNRIEHEAHVFESKKVRVLLIDSEPRYEFRFIKTLFEREADREKGRSIDLSTLLTGADPEYARQDPSAIAEFPSWETLKTFDVVILGDVDPKQFPRPQAQLKMLADFVKDRGGGLLFIAGQNASPYAYANTELADVLPVVPEGQPPPEPALADPPITQTYRLGLTTTGENHPVFRFAGDPADNAAIWGRLPPLRWYATSYRRKPAAETLAYHPSAPSLVRGEPHPLAVQQFVGAGRAMFFGFDETWLWRYRQDEPRFNQFWMQAVRSLARQRVGRVEVSVPAKTFRRDEPIRVTARFPDDAPPPAAGERMELLVERRPPGGAGKADGQRVPLTPKPNTRATYEALLTQTAEGEYRFILAAPVVPGTQPKAEATVLPPKGETEETRLNEVEMQKAAADSGGEYYTLDRAAEFLERVPDGPRVALDQPCPPLPLWNQTFMYALIGGFLLSEWVLRKRLRLL